MPGPWNLVFYPSVFEIVTAPPLQVISAFSSISRGTGNHGHPEPAASFAGALGASNVNFLQFVPMSCIASASMDFYWGTCVRTLIPPIFILMVFSWPFIRKLQRKPYIEEARAAAYVSLVALEVITPVLSTKLLQHYLCTQFDNGWFLRAELTLPCDASPRRRKWLIVASLFTIIYPIGVRRLLCAFSLSWALASPDSNSNADAGSATFLGHHVLLASRYPSCSNSSAAL